MTSSSLETQNRVACKTVRHERYGGKKITNNPPAPVVYKTIDIQRGLQAELATIISYSKGASGIIVLLETPQNIDKSSQFYTRVHLSYL